MKYTRDVYYIDNYELAELSMHEVHFYNEDLEEVVKERVTVEWDVEAAEKGGYEHFMLKEIYEQPRAVENTIRPRIKDGRIEIESRKSEIEPLMEVLDEWMAEHPDDEKQEVAFELFSILDAMHMSW